MASCRLAYEQNPEEKQQGLQRLNSSLTISIYLSVSI
jgi:hypothetical protein